MTSMIRTISSSKVSMLQVALGLLCHEKELIEHLHEYGVTCSYSEIRQFGLSAALQDETESFNSEKGLIQEISDNFNANLCTQNGLQQTHSMATIVTQIVHSDEKGSRKHITRIKKDEIKEATLDDTPMKIYTGERSLLCPNILLKMAFFP